MKEVEVKAEEQEGAGEGRVEGWKGRRVVREKGALRADIRRLRRLTPLRAMS